MKRRKGQSHKEVGDDAEIEKEVICTMFVPPNKDSMLFEKISSAEMKLEAMMDWDVKIFEQSDIPLSSIFTVGAPKD